MKKQGKMEKSVAEDGTKNGRSERLGEILVKSGLINSNQLQQVLKRQTQVGGRIGSILVEMGFITIDALLQALSQRLGVPGINLFEVEVPHDVLELFPVSKMKELRVLPIKVAENRVHVAMVNPQDFLTISEIEFMLGKKISVLVSPAFMIDAALSCLPIQSGQALLGETIAAAVKIESAKEKGMQDLQDLLGSIATKHHANDILFTAGAPPTIRVANQLKRLALPHLTPADCEMYARELIPYDDWDEFIAKKEFDFAAMVPGLTRYRVNCYRQRNSISIAMRQVVDTIPSLEQLNLPQWLTDYVFKWQGLILVTGPSGHGKTTTLSALIDVINNNQQRNIITLEDPIEILHKHRKSNINQREVGKDTPSFATGLKTVYRQSPDVIVVGEMRDRETFDIALQAADTGHLVISSVHANNATSVFDRIINMFEPHRQPLIRTKLADRLLLVLSQRLIKNKAGTGLVLAVEYLINSIRIKNFIKDQNTHQIRSQLQAGSKEFESIDIAIARLYEEKKINFEDGLEFVEDEEFFRQRTGVLK